MIKIVTKITIRGKSPEQISDWLINLNHERYFQWHPDHKSCRYIRKTENLLGSIVYFDEIFQGVRVKGEWKIVELKRELPTLFEVKNEG